MKQQKWHLRMQWKLAAPVAVLGAILFAGCGGGGSGPLGGSGGNNGGGNNPPFMAGTYGGNAKLDANTQANLTVNANANGTATGLLTLSAPTATEDLSKRAPGDFVTLEGTVDKDTGDFSLTGNGTIDGTQTPVKATGNVKQKTFTVTIGSGTDAKTGSGSFTTVPTPTPTPTPPPSSGGITLNQLVGAWLFKSITAPGGQTAACPGQLNSIGEVCGANHVIILNANGIVTSAAGSVANGTFTLTNNTLVLRLGTETTTLALTLNGNTLTARETAFSNTANPNETSTGVINTLTKLAPVTAAQLAGTYRNVSITSPAGQTVNCPGEIPGSDKCGENDIQTFGADGTYSFQEDGGAPENGTFTVAGNIVTSHDASGTLTSLVYFDGATLKSRELTSSFDTPTTATSTYVRQ